MQECLTALDNHAAEWHSTLPICWKVSSDDRGTLLLVALPTRTPQKLKGSCSCDLPLCQCHKMWGAGEKKEKSPPHKRLLPQLPRQNSQQDTSPEVIKGATKSPSQKPGSSRSNNTTGGCTEHEARTPLANIAYEGQAR